jgi:hypothetical protein
MARGVCRRVTEGDGVPDEADLCAACAPEPTWDGQAAGDCRVRALCGAGAPHFPRVNKKHATRWSRPVQACVDVIPISSARQFGLLRCGPLFLGQFRLSRQCRPANAVPPMPPPMPRCAGRTVYRVEVSAHHRLAGMRRTRRSTNVAIRSKRPWLVSHELDFIWGLLGEKD